MGSFRFSIFLMAIVGLVRPAVPALAQAPAPSAARALTLREALGIAAQQNPQLRVAAFEVQIARAQLAQARGAAAGQFNAQASFTRTQEQGPTTVVVAGALVELPPPSPNLYEPQGMDMDAIRAPG